MIVPRSRLLLWVAVIVVPFAAMAGAMPETWTLAVVFIAALAALALLDAALAAGRLNGIAVELPALTRLTKDREGEVELRVRNDSQNAREVRLGLAWPEEIASPDDDRVALLPAGAQWSRLPWPCTPLKRGSYRLGRCHLEASSPLGFWSFRATRPLDGELRAYPNLLSERRNLAAIFLHRGGLGIHAQRQVGKGREFEKLREYIAGDSFEDIHWKATAKRGRPVTKVYQVERTQEVYVVIDASRLSARDSAAHQQITNHESRGTYLERYVTAALVLGLAAERQGDLFGLATFSDRLTGFVRAKSGRAHFNACRDALYALQPQVVTPDFDELCAFLRTRLRRRALLVFLTNLDDPALAESFARNVGMISRQHLVLVNMLRPAAARPLFSDAAVASTDDMAARLGGHIQWQRLRELEKTLQRHGVQFAQLDDEKLCAELVTQYLNVKQRQLL
ncbi:MAG: DUF58 domain-containing protein [Verrucomicrobia bacterium]|nr:DUF58 domain-containing protein [Verrucomicrobiota bacterium]